MITLVDDAIFLLLEVGVPCDMLFLLAQQLDSSGMGGIHGWTNKECIRSMTCPHWSKSKT